MWFFFFFCFNRFARCVHDVCVCVSVMAAVRKLWRAVILLPRLLCIIINFISSNQLISNVNARVCAMCVCASAEQHSESGSRRNISGQYKLFECPYAPMRKVFECVIPFSVGKRRVCTLRTTQHNHFQFIVAQFQM